MANQDISVHANQVPRPASLNGLRVREDIAYTNYRGEEHGRTLKRVNKILDKLGPVLQRILAADETVLYAARMQAPVSLVEQLTMGWYLYRVSAATMIFTNRRIIQLLVDSGGKWRGNLRAVAWGDVAEARVKGWLSPVLWLKYRNGKKEKYWRLKHADAKKIKVLAATLLPAGSGESTAAQGMVALCPDCLAALTEKVYVCGGCGLAFKDERTLVKRSLLIPGGGYFYTGHIFLAITDLFAEVFLMFEVIVCALAAYGTWGKVPAKPGAATATGFLLSTLIFLALLAFEKLVTIHHGRRFVREFISTGQKDPMRMHPAAAGAAGTGWK
jgi:hypothetical protein